MELKDVLEINSDRYCNTLPCGYFVSLADGTIIDCNDIFLSIVGYEPFDLIKKRKFQELLTMGGKIYYETHYSPLLKISGVAKEINFELLKKDGHKVSVLINSVSSKDNNSNHTLYYTAVFEIRQRKQFEKELILEKQKAIDLLLELGNSYTALNEQAELISIQNKQLGKLNQTKDKFFGIVMHDLKSPLNSMKTFSDFIQKNATKISKEELIKITEELQVSLDSTIAMADNLLTWAQVQMQEYTTQPTHVSVEKMMATILNVYEPIAHKKNITVTVSIEPSACFYADSDQIAFVIRNLINNAIKFTPSGGAIKIKATSLSSELIEISVADNGTGIPPDFRQSTFSLGAIKSKRGTEGEKGTGLGLPLIQEFLNLNKGVLEFGNGKEKGAEFKIILKRALLN